MRELAQHYPPPKWIADIVLRFANIFLSHTSLRLISNRVIGMSGVETVKIIVDAEKEASKMLSDAQVSASEIRRTVDAAIMSEREKRLSSARKEAELVVQRAETESKAEAARIKMESIQETRRKLQKASSAHPAAVKALLEIMMR